MALIGARFPIAPWMAACDVLIAPGVNEGFGRGVVEAALAGTPVVASDDGGHREAVIDGKTGLLARVDDPADFARRTLALLADPATGAALAHAGRRYAQERFSIEAHVATMTSLYDRLLGCSQ